MKCFPKRLLALLAIPVLIATIVVVLMPGRAVAETGYQNPVTAVQPISRPNTPSCSVTLTDNFPFANANNSASGTVTPPAGCPGPWAMVVLDWNGNVAGRQYDRIGGVWVGGAELLRSSTPEPDPAGISWHVEKDVTEYSALLSQPQPFRVSMENYVFGPYTGILYITVTLTFYTASAQYPAPTTPDSVMPISRAAAFPWFTNAASGSVTLPRNVTGAYLEVYSTGHSCDEFWYANQPSDWANAHGYCGGTAFREFQVSIDGQLAGVAWPFPVIYTGGINPYLWRPIPGVNAYNIPPYAVNLTPFAALLDDGNAHTISISVANDFGYWLVDGDLLLTLDHGAATASGAVTQNTLAANATQSVSENVTQNGGTFDDQASRAQTISGYVDTSSGRVTTTIQQTMSFGNHQVVNLVNGLENVKGSETINTTTTTSGPAGTTVTTVSDSYPLSMQSGFQIPDQTNGDQFILPATIDQTFSRTTVTTVNGQTTFSSALTNAIHASALLVRDLNTGDNIAANGSTSQDYEYSDSSGGCYHHRISASQGYVHADTLMHC